MPYYRYNEAPKDWHLLSQPEQDYIEFSRWRDRFHRIDFNDKTFTCHFASEKECKMMLHLYSAGFVSNRGTPYQIKYMVSTPSQEINNDLLL